MKAGEAPALASHGSGASSGRRLGLALVFLVAAIWSVLGFVQDTRARAPGERFASEFSLTARRPLEVETSRLEPSSDSAAAVLADAALEDALGRNPIGELDPATRQLWIESAARLDAEIEAAQRLMVEAVARRPGWAQHRFLLGELAFVAYDRRAGGTPGDPARWQVPLRLAAAAAPGLEPIWTFYAGALLPHWSALSESERANAPAVIAQALHDPSFATRGFALVVQRLGPAEAMRLLPEEGKPLRAAVRALEASGDVAGAASLLGRAEKASAKDRERGVHDIWAARLRGDVDRARSAATVWTDDYPPREYDDSVGRAQTARVLEAWPADVPGSWKGDARARLVQFFLDHRQHDVSGAVLLTTLSALSDVPESVWARVRLLAGDEPAALTLAGTANPGSADWAPFFLELAQARLAQGNALGARQALEKLGVLDRESCEALLLGQQVAESLGDPGELEAAKARAALVWRDAFPAEAWSPAGALGICLDSVHAGGTVRVSIESDTDAIVRCGWNGGSSGRLFVRAGRSTITVPAPKVEGLHTLKLSAESGGPIRPLGAGFAAVSGPPPEARSGA